MKWVEEYIYAVVRQLPQGQREDIRRELRGLIEDMLEQKAGEGVPSDRAIEETLLELGAPDEMAAKYRGGGRYLIGPDYFPQYVTVLKIVCTAVLIGMTVVSAVELMLNPAGAVEQAARYVLSLFLSVTQAAAWVTIGFAVAEYAGDRRAARKETADWHPAQLEPLPERNRRIPRSGPVAEMVFSVLIMLLFSSALPLFGVLHFGNNGASVIPFLNVQAAERFLPLIWAALLLGIARASFKLIYGRWTRPLLLFHVFSNLISLVLILIMFASPDIWNGAFLIHLTEAGIVTPGSEGYETVSTVWTLSTERFVYFAVLVTLIDSAAVCYKVLGRGQAPLK